MAENGSEAKKTLEVGDGSMEQGYATVQDASADARAAAGLRRTRMGSRCCQQRAKRARYAWRISTRTCSAMCLSSFPWQSGKGLSGMQPCRLTYEAEDESERRRRRARPILGACLAEAWLRMVRDGDVGECMAGASSLIQKPALIWHETFRVVLVWRSKVVDRVPASNREPRT